MRTVRLLAAAAVAAILPAACGQGSQAAALTVPQALEAGGDSAELVVEGYVFADEAGIRLCEAVAESFPPQCGGASLMLVSVTAQDFASLENQDARYWSNTIRQVRGEVSGDTLTVAEADL